MCIKEDAWAIFSRSKTLNEIRKKIFEKIQNRKIDTRENEIAYLLGVIDALGVLMDKLQKETNYVYSQNLSSLAASQAVYKDYRGGQRQ